MKKFLSMMIRKVYNVLLRNHFPLKTNKQTNKKNNNPKTHVIKYSFAARTASNNNFRTYVCVREL